MYHYQILQGATTHTPDLSDVRMVGTYNPLVGLDIEDGYDPHIAQQFGRTEARNVGDPWAALEHKPERKRTGLVGLLAALVS